MVEDEETSGDIRARNRTVESHRLDTPKLKYES